MQPIEIKVKNRVYGKGRGWCFTPKNFIDLGNKASIEQALSRLVKKGFIKRLAWGLYEYPRKHSKLGELPPQINRVIEAIAQKDRVKYQPSGAYAANLLGLSEQVPAKIVLLTDGLSKTVTVGNTVIIFKKTTPKNMETAGRITGLIIQALRFIGKKHVNDRVIKILQTKITKADKQRLRLDCHLAPAWIVEIIKNKLIGDFDG